ncbi:MAG: OmpA family protein [Bacteroidia bacterium]
MRWLVSWLSLGVGIVAGQRILQQRVYGGSGTDIMVRAFQDASGYWLLGHTRSRDGLLERKGYDADLWVIRTDRRGEVLWHRTYGAEGNEELTDALRLPDGGLLLIGWTDSPSLSHGKRDAYLVRLDPLGKVIWSQAIGGTGNDLAQGGALMGDSLLWVVGQIGSRDATYHPYPYGGMDGWLLRLSLTGEVQGHATFGGSENDFLNLIIPLSPDTIWLIGASESRDGHIQNPLGKTDIWLVEVDREGRLRRSWNFGGRDLEEPYSWTRSPEGEIWLAGTSFSVSEGTGRRAEGAIWRLLPEGSAILAWSGGGSGDEGLNYLQYTPAGTWLIAGMTSSRDHLIPSLAGLYDAWALEWDPRRDSLHFCYTFGGKDVENWVALFPEEASVFVGCGTTASPGLQLGVRPYGSADFWLVWWHPDTTFTTLPPPNAPTLLAGYLTTEGQVPAWLFFRNAAGQTLDSLLTPPATPFQWQVPDSLEGELRVVAYAPNHLWKEVTLRLRKGQQNRADFYLEKIRPGLRAPLFHITFDKGSAQLKPESYPQLEMLLRFLREHPRVRIELAGHTDGTSLPESELTLSRARAEAVKAFLVQRGIAKERLHTTGFGKSRPIADNATAEGQRRNRRVEYRILAP